MKMFSMILMLGCLMISTGCQEDLSKAGDGNLDSNTNNSNMVATNKVSNQTVEASCGECQFEMEGDGCDLAVRIDGKSYYVDGANIDDHGDAHGDDGMCNCIRQAKISGDIKDGRFVATSFELLPQEKTEGADKDATHEKGHEHTDDKEQNNEDE